MDARSPTGPPSLNRAVAAVFIAALWLPLLDQVLGLSSARVDEKRRLAAAPARPTNRRTLSAFPRAFEAWYDDHFGFRASLLRLNMKVTWRLFPDSSRLDQLLVAVGKDGWLFYQGERSLDFEAVGHFTDEESARCRAVLAERAAWLAERGIAYIVLVVPDKPAIYPEYLPDWVQGVGHTCMDDFMAIAGTVKGLSVVDPRPALLAAKARERVYHRTDSHWNDRGALAAYGPLADAIAARVPQMRRLGERDVERFVAATGTSHDLAAMLGDAEAMPEKDLRLRVTAASSLARTEDVIPSVPPLVMPPFAYVQDRPELPGAVVFHDSFIAALIPLLAPGFRRTAFYWQREFDRRVVEHERPQVVIEEVVERMLRGMFPAEGLLAPPPGRARLQDLSTRPDARAGQVDVFVVGAGFRIAGWARSPGTDRPAPEVWLALGDRILVRWPESRFIERPDVAAVHGDGLLRCGFEITVPAALVSGGGRVRAFALRPDGTLAELGTTGPLEVGPVAGPAGETPRPP